jgi:targeting protein for Xklp2
MVLHSEVRSNQRAKYESEKKQRVFTLEVENLQRRALREAEEAKEIAKLRRSLVHKAQPIAHYAPVIVKPSDRPVTQPMSPHFEVDKVLQRHNAGSKF